MSNKHTIPSPCRTPADAQRNVGTKLSQYLDKVNTLLDDGQRLFPVQAGAVSQIARALRGAGWIVEVKTAEESQEGFRTMLVSSPLDEETGEDEPEASKPEAKPVKEPYLVNLR